MNDTKGSHGGRTIYDVQGDLDLDAALDDAVPQPACEWETMGNPVPCGNPATWIMSASCGHSFYYDDEHASTAKSLVESTARHACSASPPPRHQPGVRVTIRFDRIAS